MITHASDSLRLFASKWWKNQRWTKDLGRYISGVEFLKKINCRNLRLEMRWPTWGHHIGWGISVGDFWAEATYITTWYHWSFKIAMKHLNILKIVGVIMCLFISFLGGGHWQGKRSFLSQCSAVWDLWFVALWQSSAASMKGWTSY